MVIVSQDRPLVVTEFCDLYVREFNCTIMATPIDGRSEVSYRLGSYPTLQRAKEVLYEIVSAYKEGLPVFEMPKE